MPLTDCPSVYNALARLCKMSMCWHGPLQSPGYWHNKGVHRETATFPVWRTIDVTSSIGLAGAVWSGCQSTRGRSELDAALKYASGNAIVLDRYQPHL